MSSYEPTASLDEVDDLKEATDRLVEFYRQNGYAVDERSCSVLRLRRGKNHAGWYSSDMTQLATTVAIIPGETGLKLRYHIDTTGQWLTDEDRQFWQHELEAAIACARDEAAPVDLRDEEADRAEELTGELRRTGLQATIAVVLLVATLGFVAHLFGWM